MGARIQVCHGREWAPRPGAAHTGFALHGPARSHGGSRISRVPARTERGRGRPALPRGVRTHAAAVPRASPTWTRRSLARRRACGPAPCAAARPALLAAARTPRGRARRSALARRSPRSPAAHVTPRAPRRLAGGSASATRPIGWRLSVTRPAPPRPRPPAAHALPALCVDSRSVLPCALRGDGLRAPREARTVPKCRSRGASRAELSPAAPSAFRSRPI